MYSLFSRVRHAQPMGVMNGWHTFGQTLVDMYNANRLIKFGRYIIVDDATRPNVSKAMSHFAPELQHRAGRDGCPQWPAVAGPGAGAARSVRS
jgi:hypothetical protein